MRPHQWTKNLAVFVGLLFAQKLGDATVWGPVGLLFAAFCLASSCVYLFNDIRDREEDRKHPVKCNRPIASGALGVPTAWGMTVVLGAAALALGWWIGPPPDADGLPVPFATLALGTYLVLNLAYTASLKTVPIADVTCVALGFLIRVASGPAVVGLEVSPWLILCTLFGSLFLALAKRRGEFISTDGGATGRKVLKQYSAEVLDLLLGQAATATLVSYSIYTVSSQTVDKFGTTNLLYTIPIVFFGLGRYLILLYKRGKGEDPAAVLFTDRGILLAVFGWVLVSALVIGTGPVAAGS